MKTRDRLRQSVKNNYTPSAGCAEPVGYDFPGFSFFMAFRNAVTRLIRNAFSRKLETPVGLTALSPSWQP